MKYVYFSYEKNIKSAKSANKNFYWPYLGLSGSMQKDVCSILKYTISFPLAHNLELAEGFGQVAAGGGQLAGVVDEMRQAVHYHLIVFQTVTAYPFLMFENVVWLIRLFSLNSPTGMQCSRSSQASTSPKRLLTVTNDFLYIFS